MATLLRCSPGVGSIYIIQLAMKSVNARALGSHLLPFPRDRGTQCRVVCVTYLLIPFSPEVHFRGFVCCEIGRRHPQCPEPLWSGDCADGGGGGVLCFTHTFPSLCRGSGPADTSSCSPPKGSLAVPAPIPMLLYWRNGRLV